MNEAKEKENTGIKSTETSNTDTKALNTKLENAKAENTNTKTLNTNVENANTRPHESVTDLAQKMAAIPHDPVIDRIHYGCTKLLNELDRVCRANGIHYTLDSGSLIGALRHQGYIPWDDDADVAMERAEYDKLLRVADQFGAGFRLIQPTDYHEGAFIDTVPRLLLLDSRLYAEDDPYYGENANHLWLDIFIMDDIKITSALHVKLKMGRIKLLYGLLMGHRKELVYSDYQGVAKAGVFVLAHLGKLFSVRWLFDRYTKACSSDQHSHAGHFFYSNYTMKHIDKKFSKKCIASYEYRPFEDTEYSCAIGAGRILSKIYGDYMKLPTPQQVQKFYEQHARAMKRSEGFYIGD